MDTIHIMVTLIKVSSYRSNSNTHYTEARKIKRCLFR